MREAWSLALEDPEWSDRVRCEVEFLEFQSARDLLLFHLSKGPRLFGVWSSWRDELQQKQLSQDRFEQLKQLLLSALTPTPEFAAFYRARPFSQKHFGSVLGAIQVDEHLWRSPQPRSSGLEWLKSQGVGQVISLREESTQSLDLCQALSLLGRHLPVPDMEVPQLAQVQQFLDWVGPGRPPALVHCQAGQGRTGLFVACYRIKRGMSATEAIDQTDQEIFSRGMRPHQRDWVLQHHDHFSQGRAGP